MDNNQAMQDNEDISIHEQPNFVPKKKSIVSKKNKKDNHIIQRSYTRS